LPNESCGWKGKGKAWTNAVYFKGNPGKEKNWVHCAKEGGQCSCKGVVVYGQLYKNGMNGAVMDHKAIQNLSHRAKVSTSLIACNNGVFGDPLPGKSKQCLCGSNNWLTGMPVKQSSTAASGDAKRAIDGNNDGNYGRRSCTHTSAEKPAWWRIDLMKDYLVNNVRVWNRSDCCQNRLHNFEVQIGKNDAVNKNRRCPGQHPQSRSVTVPCGNRRGRFVYVVASGKKALTLCEVEIKAVKAPPGPPPKPVPSWHHGQITAGTKRVDTNTCNWMCYKNRYPDLAKLTDAQAEEHWTRHGKNEKRTCGCNGIICMHATKSVGSCIKRLRSLKKHQESLKKHRQDMKRAKEVTTKKKERKMVCRPAGTKKGARGGAAVVTLVLDTDPSRACAAKTVVDRHRFWQKSKKKRSCEFAIAITLTKKVDHSLKGAALVQSYAAVADSKGHPACKDFIWVADMIARDALGETRFDLAQQLL